MQTTKNIENYTQPAKAHTNLHKRIQNIKVILSHKSASNKKIERELRPVKTYENDWKHQKRIKAYKNKKEHKQ